MSDKPFVHLHCHTDYSLLDGACEIGQLMDVVAEQKMPAVAMTDHGNLFGAVQFYNTAKAKGIHPVIGCEVYVSQQGHKTRSDTDRYNHLVLLCESQEGYRNLINLVSTSFLEGFYYKPRVDKDLLAAHSKGLIAMSACLRGDVNETILSEKYDDARRHAYTYLDIFGKNNFFLEIQDHGLEQDKRLTPQVNRLSHETGIPLVATNDSHYLRREDARAHEILMCIQTGKTMTDPGRMHWDHPDFYLKTRDEMMKLFGELEDALDRTWDIAQRCHVKLDKVKEPFPKFVVPEQHDVHSYFEHVAREGFDKRIPRLEAMRNRGALKHDLPDYRERLDFEIKMIQQMKFSGYFLIVWDFIRYAKSIGIPVGPGRGSAAGSLVSYAMQITDIDPLQYGLLFERFLNPERVSMPDIDIDFCMNRRGEVIQYVTEKYGREQVAQIITFNTLGTRAALKDVGRVLDVPFADVDKLTKLVPNILNIGLADSIAAEPGFNELAKADPRVDDILKVAARLEGLARNCSIHAAGVVISPEPLKNLVPLYKTSKDEIVTQYDMKGLDKLALLKMDFLGLTTLTLIHDAVNLIEKRHGVKLVLEDLPLDDPKSYEVFCKGFTSGVFQFESPGMRDILRRYEPSRIEDLTALNALYRPGPIQGGMLDDFIERKQGRKNIQYDLPELKAVLEETYGVILYQEQVMQISSRLAGYSLGDADLLRRAMGKKDADLMAKHRERFVQGAMAKGHPQKKVEKIFDLMEQFAGYGFNKSHSAAYAYLAFVTAYFKAHYPIDFMAALLTSETGNVSKVVKYINECRDMGIKVLPPDVHFSDWNFTPDGEAIRFGLGAIKNLGPNAGEAIIKARKEVGKFTSLYQFCEKIDPGPVNKRIVESLIKAGAMDSIPGTRAQKMLAVESAIEAGQKVWRDIEQGQGGLFGEFIQDQPEQDLPKAADWGLREKLQFEKELLGYYVTGHPLDQYLEKAKELSTHDSTSLEGLAKGANVSMCGVMTGIVRKRNKKGEPWAMFQLEDHSGTTESLLFATNFERLAPLLIEDQAVFIRAMALPEEGAATKISIQEMVPLEKAHVPLPSLISIKVRLGKDERAQALQQLFERKPGATQVRLRLEAPRDFSVILDVPAKVRPDREFRAAIEQICGAETIEVLGELTMNRRAFNQTLLMAAAAKAEPVGSLTSVPGVEVGHFTDPRRPTGCTAILFRKGAVAGVDVRGAAPGTRETDLLNPINTVQQVHAIMLTGGSAYGLDTAAGAMHFLEEHGIGFHVGDQIVPIVPAAVLYDLQVGDGHIRPDAAAGYAACKAASSARVVEGSVGAGAGATVGKLLGAKSMMKSGLGSASHTIGDTGIIVGAIVAVNAFGDVIDPATARIIAGARKPDGSGFIDTMAQLRDGHVQAEGQAGRNTTIGVVATNASFDKSQMTKIAQMAHDGLARAINPVHTPMDGDTIFAATTGTMKSPLDHGVIGAIAAEVMTQAILRAVKHVS